MEDAPPPLAPKKSSLTGLQESKGGHGGGGGCGRESRMGLDRGGGRDSRMGAYDGRHGSGAPSADSYGRGGQQRFSMPPDVQLTTIYPPPRRFEL